MTDATPLASEQITQGLKYFTAMKVCAVEHKRSHDVIGARGIAVMINKPRNEHREFAERQRADIRDTCLNAIAFSEQESEA